MSAVNNARLLAFLRNSGFCPMEGFTNDVFDSPVDDDPYGFVRVEIVDVEAFEVHVYLFGRHEVLEWKATFSGAPAPFVIAAIKLAAGGSAGAS